MTKNKNDDRGAGELYSPSRRALLKNVGVAGAALAASQTMEPARAEAAGSALRGDESPSIPLREALENLTALEADVLEAAVERILPSDDSAPGAYEARSAHYIDRALAAHHSDKAGVYSAGLHALDNYARMFYNIPFAALDSGTQDAILERMEAGELEGFTHDSAEFFNMLRDHTIEGTFSDPYYGGNRDYIGWDLLGYPGVRLGVSEADVVMSSELPSTHQSAYDHASFTKNNGGRQ